jgi:hypothetical protein
MGGFIIVKQYWRPDDLTTRLARSGWHADVRTMVNGMTLLGSATAVTAR